MRVASWPVHELSSSRSDTPRSPGPPSPPSATMWWLSFSRAVFRFGGRRRLGFSGAGTSDRAVPHPCSRIAGGRGLFHGGGQRRSATSRRRGVVGGGGTRVRWRRFRHVRRGRRRARVILLIAAALVTIIGGWRTHKRGKLKTALVI